MSKQAVAVALMGIPGAGKSTLAKALSRKTRWPIVDRDQIRLRLFPEPKFTDAEKAAATDAACNAVRSHLLQGQSCIVDGMTFADAGQRDRLRELAHKAGARAALFWLDCPLDVAIARVQAQKDHPAGDRNANLVREVARRFAPPEDDVVRLDARLPTQELLREVLQGIPESPSPFPPARRS